MNATSMLLTSKFRKRTSREKIEWIVVHYTGVPTADGNAKRSAKGIERSSRESSTHYVAGDDGVYQIVEDKDASWHVGSAEDMKKYKLPVYNGNAIGVDIVEHKVNKKSGSVADKDWYFENDAMYNAANLIAKLMARYDLPIDRVVRHFDVTGKHCPRPFVGDDINSVFKTSGNDAWENFKMMIESYFE